MAVGVPDPAGDPDPGGERVAGDDGEVLVDQPELGVRERAVPGVDVGVRTLLHATLVGDGDAVGDVPLALRVGDRLGVVEQRDRVQRRAEHEHLSVRLDQPRERGAGAVGAVARMRFGQPGGAYADRDDARLRVRAALGARPRAQPLGDAPVLADRLADGDIEHRRLGEVGVAVLRGPLARPVDVLLPACVRGHGPIGPDRVEQRPHDGLAAPDHPAERAHPRVRHRDAAGAHAEPAQVVGEARAGHGRHARSLRPQGDLRRDPLSRRSCRAGPARYRLPGPRP